MKNALLKVSAALRKLLPTFLRGKEKAVVAFLMPIIVANLARFVPNFHVDPSLLEQVVLSAITSLSVWSASNQ
jgi:hypothetical protein